MVTVCTAPDTKAAEKRQGLNGAVPGREGRKGVMSCVSVFSQRPVSSCHSVMCETFVYNIFSTEVIIIDIHTHIFNNSIKIIVMSE